MHPLRTYDYLERSRATLLDHVATLSPEQFERGFDIGPGSLSKIFTHILLSEWYYIERFTGRDVPPYGDAWPYQDEHPLPFPELRTEWTKIARHTNSAYIDVLDWSEQLSYRITLDTGVTQDVTATKADFAAQLVLHEVHHRAQALNILRRLGTPCEDLDYNALMYDRRPVGA